MVEDVIKSGLPANQAAQLYGVSAATVRMWAGRFLAEGRAALVDRSSRPMCSGLPPLR
jgi:transposase